MGPKHLQAMAERWEELARENPMYYIATGNRQWSPAAFYASAKPQVDCILEWIGPNVRRDRMLEVGCGLGRISAQFAQHFARVDGVDIAPAMIEQAGRGNLPANVHLTVVNGDRLDPFDDHAFDFVYSGLVFQHIPDAAVIRSYLNEIARVLNDDGCAALQFDTRPENFWHRTYKSLPDALLPRTHRRFIRRYRRDSKVLRRWMRDAGLRIEKEQHPDSARHFFLLTPPSTLNANTSGNGT